MLLVVTAGEGKAREGAKNDDKRFGLLGDEGCKADNKFTEVLNVMLVDDCELEVLFPTERGRRRLPQRGSTGELVPASATFLF